MPDFDGFPVDEQAEEAAFKAAVYNLLRPVSNIRASRLLHHRIPVLHPSSKLSIPQDLTGRRLFVFERQKA